MHLLYILPLLLAAGSAAIPIDGESIHALLSRDERYAIQARSFSIPSMVVVSTPKSKRTVRSVHTNSFNTRDDSMIIAPILQGRMALERREPGTKRPSTSSASPSPKGNAGNKPEVPGERPSRNATPERSRASSPSRQQSRPSSPSRQAGELASQSSAESITAGGPKRSPSRPSSGGSGSGSGSGATTPSDSRPSSPNLFRTDSLRIQAHRPQRDRQAGDARPLRIVTNPRPYEDSINTLYGGPLAGQDSINRLYQ